MKRIKKRLTHQEEFEILKLVLDKFLWLGFVVMLFGLYNLFKLDFSNGLLLMLAGAIVLVIFIIIIIREYEIIR